jgi:hypothetical protein
LRFLFEIHVEQMPTDVTFRTAAFGAIPASQRSRDSSVSIATGYGLGCSGSIPGSVRFLSSQRPDRLLVPTQPPVQLVAGALSPGSEAAGASG